jgi:hypothetical protein
MEEMQLLHSGELKFYCIIIICVVQKMFVYEYRRHPCQGNQREIFLPGSEVKVEVSRVVLPP